ncbi:MAG: class I tRNA ligase family protein [Flavobacteriales bacterium]|nr:class I tRNA ligase family protein [Flavobacteriales bacterium]
MIQGVSALASRSQFQANWEDGDGFRIPLRDGRRIEMSSPTKGFGRFLISAELVDLIDFSRASVVDEKSVSHLALDVRFVSNGVVDVARMIEDETRDDIRNGVFLCMNGFIKDGEERRYHNQEELGAIGEVVFRVDSMVEKMSKSKFNVVNPDDIIARYGADTLRLYEMFLGPLEQSKPWDTHGIEGTYRFLRKFWNLFHTGNSGVEPVASTHRVDHDSFLVTDDTPTKAELKVLHATLKKVEEDIERMSFNTSVSQFMIATNELGALKCNKRVVLEPLVVALAPFAPHIAEELWEQLHPEKYASAAYKGVLEEPWPAHDPKYLVEDSFSYPISFNGKTRLQLEFPATLGKEEVEAAVLADPEVQKRLEGKPPKKVIVVPKRIVNIVV